MDNRVSFIKTDEQRIINEKCIKWVKKMDECLYICTKSDGCAHPNEMHKLCKNINPDSYKKLNRFFE
jgi:hypothetical protein